jgi:hypothetical protein
METDSRPHASALAAPPIVPRPHLAFWFWVRKVDWRQAGELLGVHAETARCYCLEFGNPDRRVPRPDAMSRILALTGGEVTEADFHRPRDYHRDAFLLRSSRLGVVVEGVSDDGPPGRPGVPFSAAGGCS